MPRLLADENFTGAILRGLALRSPELVLVRAQDTPAYGAPDETLLEYASENGYVLLTHDRRTLRGIADDRVRSGRKMLGVLEVSAKCQIGQAIEEIALIAAAMTDDEIANRVIFVPL